jgi:integrase
MPPLARARTPARRTRKNTKLVGGGATEAVGAGKRAGVPVGRTGGFVLDDLRHWAASTALRDGHDPVTVAARLGHSPDTLLRIYAQEIEQGQTGVAASLAARLDW